MFAIQTLPRSSRLAIISILCHFWLFIFQVSLKLYCRLQCLALSVDTVETGLLHDKFEFDVRLRSNLLLLFSFGCFAFGLQRLDRFAFQVPLNVFFQSFKHLFKALFVALDQSSEWISHRDVKQGDQVRAADIFEHFTVIQWNFTLFVEIWWRIIDGVGLFKDFLASVGVETSLKSVDPQAGRVVALKCVANRQLSHFVNGGTAGALSTVALEIFLIVVWIVKVALIKVEIHRVKRHQLRQQHLLDVAVGVLVWVTEYKAASFRRMPMQISVRKESLLVIFVFNRMLRGKNSRVEQRIRFSIDPIHIHAIAIGAPVASLDPVWVQTRDNFEHELL